MAFNVPIVLLIFRRDKITQIVDRLREIQASRIYLMADYGRNDAEIKQAEECRRAAENAIDWDCEVIKNYAVENRAFMGILAKERSGFSSVKRWQFSWRMITFRRFRSFNIARNFF